MKPLRCAVCYRILGITESPDPINDRIYCPDRVCYLYPSTARSRSEDPTLPAWLLGIHFMTSATDADASRAVDRNPDWGKGVVRAQEKRWRTAY